MEQEICKNCKHRMDLHHGKTKKCASCAISGRKCHIYYSHRQALIEQTQKEMFETMNKIIDEYKQKDSWNVEVIGIDILRKELLNSLPTRVSLEAK